MGSWMAEQGICYININYYQSSWTMQPRYQHWPYRPSHLIVSLLLGGHTLGKNGKFVNNKKNTFFPLCYLAQISKVLLHWQLHITTIMNWFCDLPCLICVRSSPRSFLEKTQTFLSNSSYCKIINVCCH